MQKKWKIFNTLTIVINIAIAIILFIFFRLYIYAIVNGLIISVLVKLRTLNTINDKEQFNRVLFINIFMITEILVIVVSKMIKVI